MLRRAVHRLLRFSGLHVERHRDAFADFAAAAPSAKCVIDGGAYHGKASRQFLRLFPSAEIHAFEPNPAHSHLFAGEPRIHLHQTAIAESNGEAAFYIPDKTFTASLLLPTNGKVDQTSVQTVALDSLALRPEAIKLDLQGGELAAINREHRESLLRSQDVRLRFDRGKRRGKTGGEK